MLGSGCFRVGFSTNNPATSILVNELAESVFHGPMSTSNEEHEIGALLEARKNAIHNKNVEKTRACFADDAVIFSLAPPLREDSPAPDALENWFGTWRGDIGNEIRDLQIVVCGDVAYASCFGRFFGTKVNGETPDVWYRETLGFRRERGQWLITHSHESVPFYMDGSNKAALDLSPDEQQ